MITVPAADSSAPTAGSRNLDNDGGDQIRFDGFVEVIHGDVGKNYFIVPFGFEHGGVQAITERGRRTQRAQRPLRVVRVQPKQLRRRRGQLHRGHELRPPGTVVAPTVPNSNSFITSPEREAR